MISDDGDVISVKFTGLAEARDTLNWMAKKFTADHEQLENDLQGLYLSWVASGSDAAGAYAESTKMINQSEERMIGLIDGFSRAVDEALGTQAATERRNRDIFLPR
jgi:patatin-like phospholipase/acyl hydrolase